MPALIDHAELLMLAIGRGVPPHCAPALCEYLAHGAPLGSFLRSVVANDLYGAVKRADMDNRHSFIIYVDFLYEAADRRSYGSYERYNTWVKTRARTVDLTEPQNPPSGSGPGDRGHG